MLAISLSEHQYLCGRAEKIAKQRIGSISQSYHANKVDQARRRTYEYFRSQEAKLHAADRACRKIGVSCRISALDIAAQIDVYQPCDEPVRYREHRKQSGGTRTTVIFGPVNTARQLMVLDVLKVTASLPEWQYNTSGRGPNRAIEHILSNLSEGLTHFVCVDIANCFPSFEQERIEEILPLPREVIRHTVMADNLVFYPGIPNRPSRSSYRTYNANALQPRLLVGLPQGSVCSPYVAGL